MTLGLNSLVRSTMTILPKLTRNENYINWSDQTLLAFKYCGIEKILTGVWTKPAVVANDADSEQNAHEWESLDTLGAEGVLPSKHIESFLRVFKQFTQNLPSRQVVGYLSICLPL